MCPLQFSITPTSPTILPSMLVLSLMHHCYIPLAKVIIFGVPNQSSLFLVRALIGRFFLKFSSDSGITNKIPDSLDGLSPTKIGFVHSARTGLNALD
ncbi:hypothetical protein VNO77_02156 [Canavalia gladiata]|uniref:Uncharacterized protein n=1 Tax=Canavalia gladiata TaxID=3824 RepID=A0AAN9MSG3_CANGL